VVTITSAENVTAEATLTKTFLIANLAGGHINVLSQKSKVKSQK
jgi:hypothetical protein